MSLPLQTISTSVPEAMKESKAVQALAGAQQHQQPPLRPLEVGILFQSMLELILYCTGQKSQLNAFLFFFLFAGWGGGPKPSGPGSGWGDHPTSWDSKASGNGDGHSGWDDGSGYKSSNNTGNTWSNNKPDRYDTFK